MPLTRTALKRKTELRRTPMRRGPRERLARTKKAAARTLARTGPSEAQKRIVAERSGYCCELCTDQLHDGQQWTAVHSYHHRQPRGMGGTSRPDVHAAYQLLLLCGSGITGCHGRVERLRETAYAAGWLVKHGHDPADVPVLIAGHTSSVRLTADGRYATTLELDGE
jgi:hypothetical protein